MVYLGNIDASTAFQESLDIHAGIGKETASSSSSYGGSSTLLASSSSSSSGNATTNVSSGTASSYRANKQPMALHNQIAQPREHLFDKYRDRINLESIDYPTTSTIANLQSTSVTKHTGRDDRATTEQVLDPRTRLILFKLLNSGVLSKINGCVSTGKEANIYHAVTPDGKSLALKIYKTSILVFKDRDRYVSGEYRFRSGYSRSNPRKMVRVWAEKELRNLKRLHTAGFTVPFPYMLRSHVLLMDFLGADQEESSIYHHHQYQRNQDNEISTWPAPKLRDANLSLSKLNEYYMEVIDLMRGMFQLCRLVHADLSEYNLLVYKGHIVVIDVSQSVETDHPRALEFLRMDCQNITDYFRRNGVIVMTPRELFDYIVHQNLSTRENEQQYLDDMRKRAEIRMNGGIVPGDNTVTDTDKNGTSSSVPTNSLSSASTAMAQRQEEEIENAVFMQSYIPQSLFAVRDAEAETARRILGEDTSKLYYSALTGLAPLIVSVTDESITKETKNTPTITNPKNHHGEEKKNNDEHSEDGTNEEDSNDDDEDDFSEGNENDTTKDSTKGTLNRQNMTKEEWKIQKAAIKEAQREKRKTKIPKHIKKRSTKTKRKK